MFVIFLDDYYFIKNKAYFFLSHCVYFNFFNYLINVEIIYAVLAIFFNLLASILFCIIILSTGFEEPPMYLFGVISGNGVPTPYC